MSTTITLSVDAANDGNPVNYVYTSNSGVGGTDKTVFIHSAHTLAARRELAFLRRLPTRAGNFKGMAKSTVKFTRAVTVPGVDGVDIDSFAIMEINFTFPVGSSTAFQKEVRQEGVALMDADAIIEPVNYNLVLPG